MIAGLGRRLGALFYDSLLVGSLLVLVATIAVVGQGMLSDQAPAAVTGTWFRLALLGTLCAYFIGFWHRAGQTPGMRAWGLYLNAVDGSPPSLVRSAVRLAAATPALLCLGAGYWWLLFDRRGCWQDRLSGTHMLCLPRVLRSDTPTK